MMGAPVWHRPFGREWHVPQSNSKPFRITRHLCALYTGKRSYPLTPLEISLAYALAFLDPGCLAGIHPSLSVRCSTSEVPPRYSIGPLTISGVSNEKRLNVFTRLALQLFLVKGFKLYSFQLQDPKEPCISIYCHYLPVSGLGNLRACCLPWMW